MKLIWPLILFLQVIHLYGQEIKISNLNKTHIIKQTNPVEINFSKVYPLSKKCCVVQKVEGHIIQIKKDSVYVLFDQLIIRNDNKQTTDISKFYVSLNDTLVIHQKDIYSMYSYRSKQHKNFLRNLGLAEAILIFGGSITLINGLLFQREHPKNLYIASGIQIGTGILLTTIFRYKKYSFDHKNNPWKFN